MIALLNPRLLIAIALSLLLAFTHFTAYRKGRHAVQLEWTAAVAEANADARRLEQQRQRRADDADRLRAVREGGIRADADSARSTVGSLRDALDAANRSREESAAAAAQRATSLGQLLAASAEAYTELAQRCDRHVNDIKALLDSWPR